MKAGRHCAAPPVPAAGSGQAAVPAYAARCGGTGLG